MHMHTLLMVTPWDQTLKTLTSLSECVTLRRVSYTKA
jgi:hypothetical protein